MSEIEEWQKLNERDRKEKLKDAVFEPLLTIDHEVLRQNGLGRVTTLMRRHGWGKVMETKEEIYKDITLRFLTTFICSTDRSGPIRAGFIGAPITISEVEISEAFGVSYDHRSGLSFEDMDSFWQEIAPGSGGFRPGRSRATSIQDPVLRCLHQLLARTIFYRGEGTGKVNGNDLVALYSMVKDIPMDISYHWKDMVSSKLRNKVKEIGLGPYITLLAKRMGVQIPSRFRPLQLQKKKLTEGMLRKWNLVGVGEPVPNVLQDEVDAYHEAETGTGYFAGGSSSQAGDGAGTSEQGPTPSGRGTRRGRHTGFEAFDFSAFDARLGNLEQTQHHWEQRQTERWAFEDQRQTEHWALEDQRQTERWALEDQRQTERWALEDQRQTDRWGIEDERYRTTQTFEQMMRDWMSQYPPPGPQQ